MAIQARKKKIWGHAAAYMNKCDGTYLGCEDGNENVMEKLGYRDASQKITFCVARSEGKGRLYRHTACPLITVRVLERSPR